MTVRHHRTIAVLGLVLVPVAGLTGCSSTGDLTCGEFNAQGLVEQTETLSDLLDEHDLDTVDPGNIQGVTQAVSQLCSSDSGAVLDDATDWDSAYW
ncbi:hypothetical protein ACI8AV_14710 [Geodermatophilus sp. SYSU D00804]